MAPIQRGQWGFNLYCLHMISCSRCILDKFAFLIHFFGMCLANSGLIKIGFIVRSRMIDYLLALQQTRDRGAA